MDKLKMQTPNLTDEKFAALAAMFPNAVTETVDENGAVVRAIDKDVLAQEINAHVVEGKEERYQFTWPDKKKSVLLANAPIAATLRPCREESVNFDTTENLYIEGDNLDVLKLLRETYLNRVKMIYIDPPYNTGNDFVYEDDFSEDADEFYARDYQYDEDGNRMVKNLDSNGRFHTDWLNMMYPRLRVARDLLTDDGVIFISIDDKEIRNLRNICDEIFGNVNLIGTILWKKKTNGNNMGIIPPVHDYIVVYAKDAQNVGDIGYEISQDHLDKTYSNPDNDPRGAWTTMDLSANHKGPHFPITNPVTKDVFYPSEGRYWVFNEKEVLRRIDDGRIIFGKSGNARPVQKVFVTERISSNIRAESWWDNHGMNEDATTEIRNLFGLGKLFTHPKPSKLLYNIAKISSKEDAIILDFFSGSATTAHAVMQLNAENGGKRKFIMVQLPELTDENSEAAKAGYKNICEIGKERIRRAGNKVISDKSLVASANAHKNTTHCPLNTNHSLDVISNEEKAEYGCKELSRSDCLAKINGSDKANLLSGEEASEGGALCSIKPDAESSSVNPVEYSGGTSTNFNERVSSIHSNSKREQGGTGNTTFAVRKSGIPCRYGHFGSDDSASGDWENAECAHKNTIHCPLKTNHSLDIGFRVLKLDSSNMKDVYYRPQDYTEPQFTFDGLVDNIKGDRTAEDLLFQVMLDLGIPLSSSIEVREIDGKTARYVNDGYLIACFDAVNDAIVTAIARDKPYYAVFRDSGFASDSTLVNFEQIFRTYSPTTQRKVL